MKEAEGAGPAARKANRERREVGRGAAALVMALTVALCSLGGYYGMDIYDRLMGPPLDEAEIALQRLRQLPSSAEGMSVEDYLIAEVQKAREAGRLHETEGWAAEPLRDMTYLVSFSFEEKERRQRAAWEVDLKHNTFVPRTDLATAASRKQ